MARLGYSYVSDKGFIAFLRDLNEGAWNNVAIKKYDAADQMPTHSLLQVEFPVAWKLRATWVIRSLSGVVGAASAEVLNGLDGDWDSTQRKLFYDIGSASEDRDPAIRDAAERLRAVLLLGNGTAQTSLSYDDEVDFGRHQVELTKNGPLADDAKKVGLGPILKQIDTTTEALAKGLGRGPGQKKSAARSVRLREALAACSSAFNAIHDNILWTEEHTPAGGTRKLLEDLRAPFEALLSRFPPPASAEKTEGSEEATADNATTVPAKSVE